MSSKMWEEITYPFLNFIGATVEVYEWISNFIPQNDGCNYLSMLGFKLIHVSKSGPQAISIHDTAQIPVVSDCFNKDGYVHSREISF